MSSEWRLLTISLGLTKRPLSRAEIVSNFNNTSVLIFVKRFIIISLSGQAVTVLHRAHIPKTSKGPSPFPATKIMEYLNSQNNFQHPLLRA